MHGLFVVLSTVAAHEEPSRGDADERDFRVVVTTSGCRACARLGRARVAIPTRARSGWGEQLRRCCRVHKSERPQSADDVFDSILLEQADAGDASCSGKQARLGIFQVDAAESEDGNFRLAGFP